VRSPRSDLPADLISRRAALHGGVAVAAAVGAMVAGCSTQGSGLSSSTTSTSAPARMPSATAGGSRVLLAYFSRPGENYYYGGRTTLDVGNTQTLATMISGLITCDVHRIEPVEPYAASYDATVERNVREQDADARPAIANPLASIAPYDTVLLGSPIWNVRTPMIMSTFADAYDFTGRRVLPFVTYAVSGLGTAVRDYTQSCRGAQIGEGLAVRGEEVQLHQGDVVGWLRRADLTG
jgi:flavodoxin